MGKGYAILIWDDWGFGLVRINPRLYTRGKDPYGNDNNWFPCDDSTTAKDIDSIHNLSESYGSLWEIIW